MVYLNLMIPVLPTLFKWTASGFLVMVDWIDRFVNPGQREAIQIQQRIRAERLRAEAAKNERE